MVRSSSAMHSVICVFIASIYLTTASHQGCPEDHRCIDPQYCDSKDDYLSRCGNSGYVCCPKDGRDKFQKISYSHEDSHHKTHSHERDSYNQNYDYHHHGLDSTGYRDYEENYQRDRFDHGHGYGYEEQRYDPYRDDYTSPHEAVYYRDYYEQEYRGPYRMSHEAHSYMKNFKYSPECGVMRPLYKRAEGRVSTGHVIDSGIADPGEFSWLAAIFYKANEKVRTPYGFADGYIFHCSGTLILPDIVLTAAHCIKGKRANELMVKIGEWNLEGNDGELFPPVSRKIRRKIIHEGYDSSRYVYDIALLVLSRPVNLNKTPHISTACLPPHDLKFKQYSKCYIAGFGEDVFKPNYGSNLLKKASVTLQKNEDCKSLLHKSISSLASDFYHDSHRCFVGGYGKDACVGDGGGAVVCPISNKDVKVCDDGYRCKDEHYFIAGIISWGTQSCGEEDSVTVITDMVDLAPWVHNILRPAGGIYSYNSQYWHRPSSHDDHYSPPRRPDRGYGYGYQ